MASIFDGIFQLSGDAPINSLFSSNNKFKTAKSAESLPSVKPSSSGNNDKQRTVDIPAEVKPKKKAKKRLVAEQAAPQQAIEAGHKRKRATASSHIAKNSTASESHIKQDTPAPAEEPRLKKRKRQDAQLTDMAQPRLAAVNNMVDDVKEVSDAGAHEAATQRLSPEEEAAKLRRTVFVGNLPSNITTKALQKEFRQYGRIESIRKRSVPVKLDAKMSRKAAIITGNVSESRGTIHAYVVFHEEPAALAALASNMHQVEGLHIRVDRAGQSAHGSAGGSVMYERNRTVFVGNLPFDVEDEELIVFFNDNCTKLGIQDPVDAVRVVRDSASQLGKGFGFVQFSDQAAARAALGCDGQLLRKRAIRVTKAVKVPAHLKDMGRAKPGKKLLGRDASERKSPAGSKQGRPSNKAVAALQRKAEPAENWQGFKTKGAKKTVATAVTKSIGTGQRGVDSKRKTPEKRPSVVMRKQRSLAK